EKALAVLEKHFGPPDSRLAIVLIRLATARISQHRHRDDAERAVQRAMALDFGPGSADACIRGEVLATSANQYFGKVRRLFLATPDLSFAAEFCLDPEEIVPICKARAEASVAR
ncbi:MAG: hypothetical protein OEV14_05605, partial [Gammaproteobacteria bacterium]|nr:hypothetical protein [Gammaproteobacteria bacterium]